MEKIDNLGMTEMKENATGQEEGFDNWPSPVSCDEGANALVD